MRNLVEDFLVYLRHERGQSEQTQKTYAGLLMNFIAWAEARGFNDWTQIKLSDLMAFLEFVRTRALKKQPEDTARKLSSESLYLQIAALRAFYDFAESEKFLPENAAENLSLPRRWQRLPKALSNAEIERLLEPEQPETPAALCDQAVLELAYASGLRVAELRGVRLEHLHLEAGFLTVIGKGNKERVVPVGRKAIEAIDRYLAAGRPQLLTRKSPANLFLNRRGLPLAASTMWTRIKRRLRRAKIEPQRHAARVAPQFCHASAGERRRSTRDSRDARPRRHQHDRSLYPRRSLASAGHPSSIPPRGTRGKKRSEPARARLSWQILVKFFDARFAPGYSPPMFSASLWRRLCLVLLSCWPAAAGAETNLFRLATFNVENYLDAPSGTRHAKSPAAQAKVRECILAIKPDVIALQEIGATQRLAGLAVKP